MMPSDGALARDKLLYINGLLGTGADAGGWQRSGWLARRDLRRCGRASVLPRSSSHFATHVGDKQATENKELVDRLSRMAAPLSVDHLGMTQPGLPVLLDLLSAGAKVKATGFRCVKMDVPGALRAIAARDPSALMFGTDLPSTRTARPFEPVDIDLLRQVLGRELARRALWDIATAFYASQRKL
jgi:hypothetical protein